MLQGKHDWAKLFCLTISISSVTSVTNLLCYVNSTTARLAFVGMYLVIISEWPPFEVSVNNTNLTFLSFMCKISIEMS